MSRLKPPLLALPRLGLRPRSFESIRSGVDNACPTLVKRAKASRRERAGARMHQPLKTFFSLWTALESFALRRAAAAPRFPQKASPFRLKMDVLSLLRGGAYLQRSEGGAAAAALRRRVVARRRNRGGDNLGKPPRGSSGAGGDHRPRRRRQGSSERGHDEKEKGRKGVLGGGAREFFFLEICKTKK